MVAHRTQVSCDGGGIIEFKRIVLEDFDASVGPSNGLHVLDVFIGQRQSFSVGRTNLDATFPCSPRHSC